MDQPIRYILCDLWVNKAKNLGTSWSKSIVQPAREARGPEGPAR